MWHVETCGCWDWRSMVRLVIARAAAADKAPAVEATGTEVEACCYRHMGLCWMQGLGLGWHAGQGVQGHAVMCWHAGVCWHAGREGGHKQLRLAAGLDRHAGRREGRAGCLSGRRLPRRLSPLSWLQQ